MKSTVFVILGFALYVAASCVDPYNPPELESAVSYLVVDGIVDVADPDSRIKLTRSQDLNEEGQPLPETGASITVEVVNGPVFMLPEVSPGEYSASGVTIADGQQCRLHIRTASGADYVSETVICNVSPPIDSVTWTVSGGNLNFEVSTHDPEGNSRYYRWKTVETVMYHSTHHSSMIWDPAIGEVRNRTAEENIYTCWKTTPFGTISLFSTNGLVEDVVRKHPLLRIPANSWKLTARYSLLVRQYVIDKSEFNFWTELRKNTESIGTIFDPQPTQVTGNIHSVDPSGPDALGYFSLGRSVEQRIYVGSSDLPPPEGGYEKSFVPGCSPFSVDTIYIDDYRISNKLALLLNPVYEGPLLVGYRTADALCVDCRLVHGGVNTKPDFWE
jgi:hypothetical protein